MSAVGDTGCPECGRKLHTTFFCQECGQPCCCLDCSCRHEATHAGVQETPQTRPNANPSSARLEPAR